MRLYKMVQPLLFLTFPDACGRGLRTALVYVSLVRPDTTDCLPDRLVENALQIPLRQRGALQVLLGLDLLCDHDGLLVLYGCHFLLPQALLGRLVIPQIEFGADEDNGYTRRVVVDLRIPLAGSVGHLASVQRQPYLCLDVIKRGRADNGEAD